MDHTGQENIWFVGCSTTARATPAPGESVLLAMAYDSIVLMMWISVVLRSPT